MAYLRRDRRSGKWCVGFRYNGQEYHRSCRTDQKSVARRIHVTVEETIDLLETGRLVAPENVDIAHWIFTGGKANGKLKTKKTPKCRFGAICDDYMKDQRQKAETTLYQEQIHIRHLKRILKSESRLCSIDLERLKQYADQRSEVMYRGKAISSATIRKELTTFRQIWVWAQRRGHVANSCPLLGPEKRWELQLPKPVERVKFQTWEQIERRIERGGLSSAEIRKLWEGLYLDEDRIRELLVFFKEHAAYSFIYPMLAFGVYTGARRSEILRSQIDDIDFQTDQIIIRERKRRKHLAASTRYVPLHPRLRSDLQEWFEVHPGGQFTIACPEYMQRRKRTNGPQQLTLSQATHHFKHTLRKSKWDVVRGFHVLRHSFGSNLARSGKVPSEVIAAFP